jgi:hypothetical protein
VLYKKQDGSGYAVIEEWETEEDCDRYTRLMQIVQCMQLQGEPLDISTNFYLSIYIYSPLAYSYLYTLAHYNTGIYTITLGYWHKKDTFVSHIYRLEIAAC